ncbi:MAG: hypothetical protein QOF18_2642 [Frankiaceae bacterium]|nr:hypothetical protein [Frankiaceae bacterium]
MTVSPLRLQAPPAGQCECGHALARHDPIASRFCLATAAGALERGCICSSGPKHVRQS